MNPNIFREFSIRGLADQDLSDEVLRALGWAIGIFFHQQGVDMVVFGRDGRLSSARLSTAAITGCAQAGVQVIDIGLTPTPMLNFATDYYQAGAGVMVTASHNPPEFNGLKIRSHRTLTKVELQQIYQIAHDYPAPGPKAAALAQAKRQSLDPLPPYLERVKALAPAHRSRRDQRNLKVVVDGGHGTNGKIVSQLLRELELEVVELYCEPDGVFPGRGPDPTAPAALRDLAGLVQATKADVGIAYDGDGDRLAVVDESGQQVLGDQIIMILARAILRRGPAKIVYEILCSQAVADDIVAHGGEPLITPSGYAFVHEAMQREQAALGGEFSGHLFFAEPDFRFDDAIVATVKLLQLLTSDDRPFSTQIAALPAYHASPQIRLACPDGVKAQVVNQVRQHFAPDYRLDTIDGVRIHFEAGWAIVRQSNTQPVISMRFEARSAEALKMIQQQVQSFVEREIAQQRQIV